MIRRDYTGSGNPNWRGGRRKGGEKGQYVLSYAPEHPHSTEGAVLEHRLVVEQALGRPLERREVVHHLNGDKHDNRLENLRVMSQSDHARLHDTLREHAYRRPPVRIALSCEWCHAEFTVTKTRDGSRRFCSAACYFAHRHNAGGQLRKGVPA